MGNAHLDQKCDGLKLLTLILVSLDSPSPRLHTLLATGRLTTTGLSSLVVHTEYSRFLRPSVFVFHSADSARREGSEDS